jgi:hypothetical protein
MRRYEYLLAQFGKRAERERSRAMLLDLEDLPAGDWKVLGDRQWRTGAIGEQNEIVQRAIKSGSFTAWRSFKLLTTRRGIWLEVIPYASAKDADSAVPGQRFSFRKNPKLRLTVTGEREIDDLDIPGVSTRLIFEKMTDSEDGPGASRYVVGSVDRFVFVVVGSEQGGEWQWSEMASVSALQARKIQSILDGSNH